MLSSRTMPLHCGCTAVNLGGDAYSLFPGTVQVPPLAAELGQTSLRKHRLKQQTCMPVLVAPHCTEAQDLPSWLWMKSIAGLAKEPPVFSMIQLSGLPETIGVLLAVVFQLHYKELVAKNEELDRYKAIIDGLSGQR